MLRPLLFVAALLALTARSYASEEDEYPPDEYDGDGAEDYGDEGYGGGYGDDDEGYGGGGEEPPAEEPTGTTELESVEDFELFLQDSDASVIAAVAKKELLDPAATKPEGWDDDEDGEWVAPMIENPWLTTFNEIVSSLYGFRVAITFAPEVHEKMKMKSSSALYLYRSPRFLSTEAGDRPRERFPADKLSDSAVSNWLNAKSQPLVGLYNMQTKSRFSGPTLVIFMNLDFVINAKSVQYVLKRARKAAAPLKGKLAITLANLADMTFDMREFGLESTKSVDILMGITAGGQYYGAPADTSFTGNALAEFGRAFLAGELTPHEKPDYDPPPADGIHDGGGEDDDYNEDDDDDLKDEP